ncbi:MAG TPA: ABC transporter substrate-binding protein, partial [Pseudomonadales bacterium]|nr:ABC transporter substrate-binding protein [Pseudomonadales bacterium]
TLRIGIHAWPAYEFFYLAQERGLFRKYDIDVEMVEFDSSVDSMRAFAHGNIDAFCGTSVELITSQLDSPVAAKAIHVIDFSNGADQIIASPAIRSLADLKGRRIAFESGTLDYVTWSYALKQAGMNFSDVKVESIPQSEIIKAFRQGRIDAAATYPPVSTMLVQENLGHPIFDSSKIPGIIVDLLVVRDDLIRPRKSEWIGVIKALADAQSFAVANPQDAYAVMAKREQIDVDRFQEALQGIHLVTLSEQYGLLKEGGKIFEALSAASKTLAEKGLRIDEVRLNRLYSTEIAQEVMAP